MESQTVTYWYEGTCSRTGERLRLPRTQAVEAIAQTLMGELAQDELFNREGKMYGVLLVEDATGNQQVLKAFSGLLNGVSVIDGWVPSIPGRATIAFEEALTLSQLNSIQQELLALQQLPARSQLAALTQHLEQELHQLAIAHHQRKQARQQQRQHLQATLNGDELHQAIAQLNRESQQDGIQRRQLKAQHHEKRRPLQQSVAKADSQIQSLKQQRKHLSRQLQEKLYTAYCITNFAGQSTSLHHLMSNGLMPTGTGDCCAPKLLHYAATQGLKPLAMAEFWWGATAPHDDKIPGEFYGACRDRCQPIMGFLLAGIGMDDRQPTATRGANNLPILYEDEWIVAVEKPAGLLSVPGRYRDRQDSVWSRLHATYPNSRLVHRLDQDTSGILLLARDLQTYRQLSQQFQRRQIHKIYEAVLVDTITAQEGVINLPLGGNSRDRPRQWVDWQQGKPSITKFRVLTQQHHLTRVELFPLTGRTHQLRVHAAHPQGFNAPILGDRLYGLSAQSLPPESGLFASASAPSTRLHLHAKSLMFPHPHTGRSLHLQSTVPF